MAPLAQAATEAVLSLLRYGQACMQRTEVHETVLCSYFGELKEDKRMHQRQDMQPTADLITTFFGSVISQRCIAARPLCTRAALRIAALDAFCESSMIRRHGICNLSTIATFSQASCCMPSHMHRSCVNIRHTAFSSARCLAALPSDGLAACSGVSGLVTRHVCNDRCTLVYNLQVSVPPMPLRHDCITHQPRVKARGS
jgi:hypothetical protein